MNVRRAQSADLDAILAIEGAWPTTPHWTRRQFQAEVAAPASLFLVADDAGEIAGYSVTWRVPPEAQLLNIAVAPRYARRGVATLLLAGLKVMSKGFGCVVVTLEVSERNPAGRAFYEKQGFRLVGRRPKFYTDGSDALLMDLSLG